MCDIFENDQYWFVAEKSKVMGDRLNIFPSRGAQTLMKGRLKGAKTGHSLLKKKADALQLKFRSILKKIIETKQLMGEVMKEASFSLAEAKFASGGDLNQVRRERSAWSTISNNVLDCRPCYKTSTRRRSKSRRRMTMLLGWTCLSLSPTRFIHWPSINLLQFSFLRMAEMPTSLRASPREVNSWRDWRLTIRRLSTCWSNWHLCKHPLSLWMR